MIKVIKFSSTTCQPCKVLNPIIDEIKKENPDINFQYVDVYENLEITKNLHVTSVPTVIILKNEREVFRFSGIKSKQQINNLINQYK